MNAFRAITVRNNKAYLNVLAGENKEEVTKEIMNKELIQVKDVTKKCAIDLCEISEALRFYEVDEQVQMLVISILEKYDNVKY